MERNSNSGAAQPEPRQGPQLGTRGPGSTPSDPDPFGDNDVDTERARICQYSSASTGKNIFFLCMFLDPNFFSQFYQL